MITGWSLWSKDIILVVPPDSKTGTQAWVDAYHDAHNPELVSPLPLKSGALQGAIAIDYPQEQHFKAIHVIYDGPNGQLPNLDLINSIVNIAGGQMGMTTSIQKMKQHTNKYPDRLRTMLRGMLNQGLGYAAGAHSSFIPYHVDAVTLQPYGEGFQDEMAMGRLVEGSFRSLNNLLEHLHQSFFFYLLMQTDRFVSIGTYLPSAMLLAANFTIMAISLWVKSGQSATQGSEKSKSKSKGKKGAASSSPTPAQNEERDLFLPLAIVAVCHALSVVPLYTFNRLPASVSPHSPLSLPRRRKFAHITSDARSRLRHLLRHLGSHTSCHLLPRERLLQADDATLPAYKVLLPARPRHVPLHPRHSQLLSRLPHRCPRNPAQLRSTGQEHRCPLVTCRPAQCGRPIHCCVHRRPDLGCQHRRPVAGSELWLERVGHVHPRAHLVSLVASVDGRRNKRVWHDFCLKVRSSVLLTRLAYAGDVQYYHG